MDEISGLERRIFKAEKELCAAKRLLERIWAEWWIGDSHSIWIEVKEFLEP